MYWLLRTLSAIICRLPEGVIDRLAKGLAWIGFDCVRLRRSVVLHNLALAFPEKTAAECRAIGRASYYHFLLTAFEFFYSRAIDVAATVNCASDIWLTVLPG